MPKGDVAAERFILSAMAQQSEKVLCSIDEIIDVHSFTDDKNKLIFEGLTTTYNKYDKIDINLFMSSINDLGYNEVLDKDKDFIRTLFYNKVDINIISDLAIKIKKIEIAKHAMEEAKIAYKKLENVTGNESLEEITSILEKAQNNIDANLTSVNSEKPEKMFGDAVDLLEYLEENPVDQIGISTGYPIYDQIIGGGLRQGYINLIVARPKSYKSTIAVQIGTNIACDGIPVLYLDTEMDKQTQQIRKLSALSTIEYKMVETGKFKDSPKKDVLYQEAEKHKDIPLFYKRIAGKKFEEILGVIKSWVREKVGKDEEGNTKPCVVVYDYFKLMNTDDMKDLAEHQALGFQLSSLTDYLGNEKVACLAYVQSNRNGIDKETTDIVSQSDRLVWLCASLCLLRKKSKEEIIEDPDKGNLKLIPLDAMRFSEGLDGDHIDLLAKNFHVTELGVGNINVNDRQ